MRGKKRSSSIQSTIVGSFAFLILLIIIALLLLSYRITIREAEEISISYMNKLLGEVNTGIDSYIEHMKSMGTVVVENQDVRRLLTFYNKHKRSALSLDERGALKQLEQRASSQLNTIANTRRDIVNIVIVSKYGDVVLDSPNKRVNPYSFYHVSDWYLKPMSTKDDIVVTSSHVQDIVSGEYRWVISISKAVLDPDTGEVTGVMLIDLNYRSIEEICARVQLGINGYIYLMDNKANLIYHPEQQSIYFGIRSISDLQQMSPRTHGDPMVLQRGNELFLRNDSQLSGWTAVGVVHPYELTTSRVALARLYVALAVTAILFAVLLADSISRWITHPITRLESTMRRVEAGDMTAHANIDRDDEIGHMSQTFNTMVSHLRSAMHREVAKEEEKRKSEIRALQAQINPHFLYNTLDSIIWLSASNKGEEVMDMTSALAQLFRTSISQGDSLVPVQVEIDNIQSYLTIQKIRYKDKLRYTLSFADDVMQLKIPKLILQPIVENAIYHGIKPHPDGGIIHISVERKQTELIFIVEDDGVGMSDEQLAQVFQPGMSSRGIGIRNVEERIRLWFGDEYGLRYSMPGGGGVRAEIHLPVVEDEFAKGEADEGK